MNTSIGQTNTTLTSLSSKLVTTRMAPSNTPMHNDQYLVDVLSATRMEEQGQFLPFSLPHVVIMFEHLPIWLLVLTQFKLQDVYMCQVDSFLVLAQRVKTNSSETCIFDFAINQLGWRLFFWC